MKKLLAAFLVLGLLAAGTALTTPDVATATDSVNAQANVLNFGRDGITCFVNALGGGYTGPATLVQTPSGNINGNCNAQLVAGAPVAETTKVDLLFGSPFGPIVGSCVFTKSGNVNCSF